MINALEQLYLLGAVHKTDKLQVRIFLLYYSNSCHGSFSVNTAGASHEQTTPPPSAVISVTVQSATEVWVSIWHHVI